MTHQHQDNQVGPTVADISSPKYQGQKNKEQGLQGCSWYVFFYFHFLFYFTNDSTGHHTTGEPL